MTFVPGTTCKLRATRWEGETPVEGDFLRSDSGTCYRIDRLRPAGPRATITKMVLECTRLERDAVQAGDPGVWRWYWDKRG